MYFVAIKLRPRLAVRVLFQIAYLITTNLCTFNNNRIYLLYVLVLLWKQLNVTLNRLLRNSILADTLMQWCTRSLKWKRLAENQLLMEYSVYQMGKRLHKINDKLPWWSFLCFLNLCNCLSDFWITALWI